MSTPGGVRSHQEVNSIKPTEAAARLGITRQAVHGLLKRGRLKGEPILGPVNWNIDPASVEEYRRTQKEEGRPEAA